MHARDHLSMRRYMTLQMQECEEHKYFLSKNRCQDVSMDDALMDWTTTRVSYMQDMTHAARFSSDYETNFDRITATCNALCGNDSCGGVGKCPLGLRAIHRLLND